GGELMREAPFAVAEADEGQEGLDRVMVRGRIDLMAPVLDAEVREVEVVDYKTDRVMGAEIEARAEEYRGQIEMYRRAINAVGKRRVRGVHLVFLTARRIWSG
ncbi:MAG TPA: PD-(D/E)XK nuclease family protein, partial [Tepidisphaeraceae bacterium]|nr:PD-(D/E)XK nuclease family protein [Tepidisphaeraceae bacterium]